MSYNHLICWAFIWHFLLTEATIIWFILYIISSSFSLRPTCTQYSYPLWIYLPITFILKMSDNGSGTPLCNVNKIITKALKVWEESSFKDRYLWKIFQDNFNDFIEEDFTSASVHHQRRLRAYLQKYGVWVQKQQRYTITRSLYEVLFEEKPTPWTETKIIACEKKEEFALYHINRLLDSDFGRKPRRFHALTPTSPTRLPPAATSSTPAPSAPAPFASPSPTLSPSAQAPANTPIYPIQPPGISTTFRAYMLPLSIRFPP